MDNQLKMENVRSLLGQCNVIEMEGGLTDVSVSSEGVVIEAEKLGDAF